MEFRSRPGGCPLTLDSLEPRTARRGLARLGGVLCAVIGSSGCASAVWIAMPVAGSPGPSVTAPAELRAGMASVDITPPPGLPSLGYSIAAKHSRFNGHRTRLRAHTLVLEDAAGSKVALVTMDLSWGSALLNWKIAERLAPERGFTVDRLLVCGTHAHTGPAGYSSAAMYNEQTLGGGGYDPDLVAFLVERLCAAIRDADDGLTAARLTIGRTDVSDLTKNRSPEAQAWNKDAARGGQRVDPTLTMVRVDGVDGGELGAFLVFGGHPTVTGPEDDLWHGDVFGVAVHELRRLVRADDPEGGDFVVALANGAEGDVSFRWEDERAQDHDTAVRFGQALARHAKTLHDRLGSTGSPAPALTVDHRYEEVEVRGARLEDGTSLCEQAVVGAAAIGGAEDGRTFFHPWAGREGKRARTPRGCHGAKVTAFGCLQGLLLDQDAVPHRAPIQVVRIGSLHLVALPFEMTVMAAAGVRERVRAAIAGAGGAVEPDEVVVLSLANDYFSYCATAGEYDAQHYEGGFTLYGPRTAAFLAERSAALARAMHRGERQAPLLPRLFNLGRRSACGYRFPVADGGEPPPARKLCRPVLSGGVVKMRWSGLDRGRIHIDAGWLVAVEYRDDATAAWKPVEIAGEVENDLGFNFTVRLVRERRSASEWEVTWRPPGELDRSRRYRFVVAARPGAALASSEEFRLDSPDLPSGAHDSRTAP